MPLAAHRISYRRGRFRREWDVLLHAHMHGYGSICSTCWKIQVVEGGCALMVLESILKVVSEVELLVNDVVGNLVALLGE